MNDYFVFGGRLRSELEFSDLSAADGEAEPDWLLRCDSGGPPASIELIGTRWIEPGWVYRLHRVEEGLCLEYGGTGSYGIFAGGREIVWFPGSEPEDPKTLLEMARAIVLGPVMALALQQWGILCLHGSAVSIDEQGVAFIAPKLFGKSTLALALTARGARLLTDDLVAIDASASPLVRPGVHSVRVSRDMAERVGPPFPEATFRTGFKTTITDLHRDHLAWHAVPLAAVYTLEPVPDLLNGSPVRRERLQGTRAAAALIHGKKLTDGLIGSSEAGAMLNSIAAVSEQVPIYRMPLVRDLERLPEVVEEIMGWHQNPRGRAADERGQRDHADI